jgi:hypothetical protein
MIKIVNTKLDPKFESSRQAKQRQFAGFKLLNINYFIAQFSTLLRIWKDKFWIPLRLLQIIPDPDLSPNPALELRHVNECSLKMEYPVLWIGKFFHFHVDPDPAPDPWSF